MEEREKWGRPGNTYHVNDVSGGCEVDVGGRCPTTNLCAINHRASFLPVKSSAVDLVNVWGLDYCWNA